jgi:hypothetical protein
MLQLEMEFKKVNLIITNIFKGVSIEGKSTPYSRKESYHITRVIGQWSASQPAIRAVWHSCQRYTAMEKAIV